MNREFLDLYNRELGVLNEDARAFAQEYPGIAERLGGLVEDRADPMIAGLLEGAAFLAARVQLKLKHEFPEFTASLLEQLVPHYLAPTPSVLLARIGAPYGDPALRAGRRIARGAILDAAYSERERRVACRYRLTRDVVLWPFAITAAEYCATPAGLSALGLPVEADVAAGLRLTLTHRTAADPAQEEGADPEAASIAGCAVDDLPVHLVGPEADAVAIYEALFSASARVAFRVLDAFGDPVVVPAPPGCLAPVGFEREEALLPNDLRVFEGFDLLREYFMFPRKFLGFRLTGLREVLPRLTARSVDVIVTFRECNARLAAAVRPEAFALYAAPAVNLFEMTTDRVPVRAGEHEHHLVPDRSRMLDFEPHRVLDVYAHVAGRSEKRRVEPLHAAQGAARATGPSYTLRRLPRRRSSAERQAAQTSDYCGTEIFLTLVDSAREDEERIAELSVRALCSNRHLPEHLPVGAGGTDFRLADDADLEVLCVAGPTRPREPVVAQMRGRAGTAWTGEVAWRLVNMLSLNHLGLVRRGAGASAEALREMLSLFADLSDAAVERRIRGVRSVDSRPVVRRLRQRLGTGTARGTEVTVTLDERAFEGTGAFLLGAVLDRFYAEYAGINHFTQTVIRTTDRGEIMRWPPRAGARAPL
ncbi:type VI secretion system baseplate subunit TssF [Methylobacterium nodulans]|uniref:Type VI secretion protein, VC_A0110 family n=1 Tax=Methylobacterium nodulans (strain LMG 21967 / CNCM I-2342 / ORS 2060) TaxID=460265 RepID=B8IIB0_METNO|nr:type VI secretion system baseplate subunit TssF [Methylobacterium nodulans]ACL57979.1 type VI secretion protein, VC_A0110 family [Methylobacterium nodulans ORS 2060]